MERRRRICEVLGKQHRLAEIKLGLARRQWPEWLMLIDLYQAEQQEMQVGFETLAGTSGLSVATAFRRTLGMIEVGTLERVPDPADKRRSFVMLSERARGRMDVIIDEFAVILFA
ncbi:MAG: MarR family transcriptional regulator [Novosphingobium sp.]